MSLAREPAVPPTASLIESREILFRHPFYGDSNNVLLKLFASDPMTDGAGAAGLGLYAQFALDACGVIAGNRWDGWLSESKDSDVAATTIHPTSILLGGSYYFHLPPLQDIDPTLPYPIVPTFREWRFPHDQLPESWKRITPDTALPARSLATSNFTFAVQTRDASCRITGCRDETQAAHICPLNEAEWWYANAMTRYNVGCSSITPDNISNALLLRADLHLAFDKPKFVLVPKPSPDPEHPQIVVHLLEASPELEYLYHNRRLQSVCSSIQMLFARFAWTVFPLLKGFLVCRERRRLLLTNEIMENSGTRDGFVSWEKCVQLSKSRSQSPKKRRRDGEANNDDEACDAGDEKEDYEDQGPVTQHASYCTDKRSIDSDQPGPKRYRDRHPVTQYPSFGSDRHGTHSESQPRKRYRLRYQYQTSSVQNVGYPDLLWNRCLSGSVSPPCLSLPIQQTQPTQAHLNLAHSTA